MERDFLSLATTSTDANNDSVKQRGSGMQWCFSDRVSVRSQGVSSESYPEEKPKRDFFYQVPSPGFLTATTAGNSSQQSDMQPVYHHQGVKLYPVQNNQNKATPSTMNCPVLQSHTFLEEQNVGGFTSIPQTFGCVSTVSPASRIPTRSCFPTYNDMRISNEPSSGPAQLTIFYAGSVTVYDSVSPEKVRAIMLLAGDGTSSNSPSPAPFNQVQVSFTKPSTHDVLCIGNPPRTSSTKSGLVSPFSHAASQCGDVSNPLAMTSSQQQPDLPQPVNSHRSSAGYVIPGPVPQARKASLARFLEKRKERVTSTQPYSVEQKSSERERNMSSASDNLSCSLRSPG